MGIVYLIISGTTDKYKIGVSKNPKSRIRGLQTGNPLKLSIIDSYESDNYQTIETILHRFWKHKKYVPEDFENLKGEWFNLTNEDVKEFKEVCIKIEKNINHIQNNSSLKFKL
jgi:hypothetical protein